MNIVLILIFIVIYKFRSFNGGTDEGWIIPKELFLMFWLGT